MKTVFLIRHAKSDWSHDEFPDIDRYLNLRGYTDAHRMGVLMKEKKLIPEQMVSSPAIRAISTSLILAREMNYPAAKIEMDPTLYEQGVEKYLDRLRLTDDTLNTISITGHNPLISEAALYLTKHPIDFPTCAIVVIKLNIQKWSEIFVNCGKAAEMLYPKAV